MCYGKAENRAQVAIPPDDTEDELGFSDEECDGESDLADTLRERRQVCTVLYSGYMHVSCIF